MEHSEPSVVAPTDLENYYRSIEHPFWVAWRSISRGDDPTGLFLVGFLLCFVPVIPFLGSTLAHVVYGSPTLHVWGLRFEPSSFWLWWPATATASFLLLMLIGRSQGRLTAYKIRQLSPQQLRFAYCYGALDELRKYRSSGSAQHIEAADAYLRELGNAMMRASTLDLAEGAYPYHYWQSDAWIGRRNKKGEHASVGVRLNLPRWYRLQPETEEIVKAFPRVSRLKERVADRKDLEVVESALTDLGMFLYTEIPNVPWAGPRAVLERSGTNSLLSFARKINTLPVYERQPVRPKPRRGLQQWIAALVLWLTASLTHENVITAFFTWYFLTLVLEIAACFIAFRLFSKLTMDTALMATLIGTPFLVAAAGLVVSKRPTDSRD
jgi:hypothetical protein